MSGFSLGGAVNGFADWVCSAPLIHGVISNPVFTSLLITALAAVVVLSLYGKPVRHGDNKRGCRALLYVFLLVTTVIFVHHYAVMRAARDMDHTAGVRAVYAGIEASRAINGGGTMPVYLSAGPGRGDVGRSDFVRGDFGRSLRADNVAAADVSAADQLAATDGNTLEDITDVVLPLGGPQRINYQRA
jgi:hypothetical protein